MTGGDVALPAAAGFWVFGAMAGCFLGAGLTDADTQRRGRPGRLALLLAFPLPELLQGLSQPFPGLFQDPASLPCQQDQPNQARGQHHVLLARERCRVLEKARKRLAKALKKLGQGKGKKKGKPARPSPVARLSASVKPAPRKQPAIAPKTQKPAAAASATSPPVIPTV